MPKVYKSVSTVNLQSNAVAGKETKFDLQKLVESGTVPPEYLGLNIGNKGSSGFSQVAHAQQTQNQIANLLNSEVSDQIVFSVQDGRGGKITAPFMMNGKQYKPDSAGNVRITDQANVDLALKIKRYKIERVDKLMEYAMISNEMCSYIFGLSVQTWEALCKENGGTPNMSPDLIKLNCNIDYIESLPPSITQTQSIAKLRKLVEHFEKNVNLEGLSKMDEVTENMRTGINTDKTNDSV